ncbi:BglG family transcription antiterminator [Anoxybacteroides tepidamans]|uniref:BglG family transcription antiterminator n=1 Tax=Anoxybacteroides tepidamans TaxID=265948 RepID=UPI000489540C|nr:BglG family transcription antiterminator [Anoxybacillus tepidamans]
MYISARERKIVEVLLANEKGITVGELAEQLDVSDRTIHRDLKGVETILNEFGLQLLKKAGVGIQVIGEDEKKKDLQALLLKAVHAEYTPEERQTLIAIALLEAGEPVKLLSLAHDLNVTVATISNDLDKMEETFKQHGLSLLRKRGYGVEVVGLESAKRKMMGNLLFHHFNESEFLSIMKQSMLHEPRDMAGTVTEKLLGLVDKEKLFTIEKQLEMMKGDLPFAIADNSYIALVIHLALAIERIAQGEAIHFEPQYFETIRSTKEYRTAEKIAASLESAFQMTIPKEEIGYITMHLMGAKLRDRRGYMLEEGSLEIGRKVQELIRFVSRELHADLTDDYSLYEDLIVHLKPALYRIRHHMGITNPLLHTIRRDYLELFSVVERGMAQIFSDVAVPQEEIGYVVLHFASALLREKNGLHALVICSSGLGTAKILATRLKKEIPNISSIEQKSFFELHHVDANKYDIIISTVPIHTLDVPYFVVSPMLEEEEAAAIRQFLRNQKAAARKKQLNASGNTVQKMNAIQAISETIVQLLSAFAIEQAKEKRIPEVLAQACGQLQAKNIIQDSEQVLDALLERERMGGLGIPGTALSLYHARHEAVLRPSLTIYDLIMPETVMGMHGQPMDVKRILLLVAPKEASEEMLAVLSHVSSLVVKDEESMDLFSYGSEDELRSFLSGHLEKFFYEHLQQRKE